MGTGVNILTQANPLYLAKQASSIDHLSGGRLLLGLGVGWLEEEFKSARRSRSSVAVPGPTSTSTRCGRRGPASQLDVRGEFLEWTGFRMLPRPRPDGGVPVVVGGTTDAAIRRVVARGDGWYVIHKDLDQFRSHIQRLHDECARQGRDPAEIELTAYWNHHREGTEGLAVYAEAGVSRVLVNLAALRMGSPEEAATRFADEVLAAG